LGFKTNDRFGLATAKSVELSSDTCDSDEAEEAVIGFESDLTVVEREYDEIMGESSESSESFGPGGEELRTEATSEIPRHNTIHLITIDVIFFLSLNCLYFSVIIVVEKR